MGHMENFNSFSRQEYASNTTMPINKVRKKDTLFWLGTKDDSYNTKSGYQMVYSEWERNQDRPWESSNSLDCIMWKYI